MKNVNWEKLFICETNKACRGGGRKSPREPASHKVQLLPRFCQRAGAEKYGAFKNIKKERC